MPLLPSITLLRPPDSRLVEEDPMFRNTLADDDDSDDDKDGNGDKDDSKATLAYTR